MEKLQYLFDFEFITGKRTTKHSTKCKYKNGTHTKQRLSFAKKSKIKNVIAMIKRVKQRNFQFKYLLWDSWFSCTESYSYVFKVLIPAGKTLISMVKRDKRKYLYNDKYLSIKELKKVNPRWKTDSGSGIKYKSIQVKLLDTNSSYKIEDRKSFGIVKLCFYKYPNIKRWKVILSTDTSLSELEVLEIYLKRWAVECVFKEIKQLFGYDQSKSSNYAPMIADLTIRYVFYIMLCYRRQQQIQKSMWQIVLEFYQELFDIWLFEFIKIMFKRLVKYFIEYAIAQGVSDLRDLRENIDSVLQNFFECEEIIEKITEADNDDYIKVA